MAGINHDEKREMSRFVFDANRTLDATIVLIEHDIGVVMGLFESKPTTRSERIHSRLADLPLAPKSGATRNDARVKDRARPAHLERMAPRLIRPARLSAQISG